MTFCAYSVCVCILECNPLDTGTAVLPHYFAHNGKFVHDLGLAYMLLCFYTHLMIPKKVETGRGLLGGGTICW